MRHNMSTYFPYFFHTKVMMRCTKQRFMDDEVAGVVLDIFAAGEFPIPGTKYIPRICFEV